MSKPVECTDCIEAGVTTWRPITEGPGKRCATHRRARKTAVRKANHERRVQRVYGLAPGEYERLYEAQGGLCAMCGPKTGRNGSTKRLAVDHDHSCCPGPTSCGECVRGLLCSTCNKLLGQWGDDPEMFDRGRAYVSDPPARKVLRRV